MCTLLRALRTPTWTYHVTDRCVLPLPGAGLHAVALLNRPPRSCRNGFPRSVPLRAVLPQTPWGWSSWLAWPGGWAGRRRRHRQHIADREDTAAVGRSRRHDEWLPKPLREDVDDILPALEQRGFLAKNTVRPCVCPSVTRLRRTATSSCVWM